MTVYDDPQEDDFWLIYEFTKGDGTKYLEAKELPWFIVLNYAEANFKEQKEINKLNG